MLNKTFQNLFNFYCSMASLSDDKAKKAYEDAAFYLAQVCNINDIEIDINTVTKVKEVSHA